MKRPVKYFDLYIWELIFCSNKTDSAAAAVCRSSFCLGEHLSVCLKEEGKKNKLV
jgi:hypothetical protein